MRTLEAPPHPRCAYTMNKEAKSSQGQLRTRHRARKLSSRSIYTATSSPSTTSFGTSTTKRCAAGQVLGCWSTVRLDRGAGLCGARVDDNVTTITSDG